jgi:hypothetical protein
MKTSKMVLLLFSGIFLLAWAILAYTAASLFLIEAFQK